MITRRRFVAFIAALGPVAASPQDRGHKTWRIGWLANVPPVTSDSARLNAAFRQSLAERGFVEGRDIAFEYRYGQGDASRYPSLAKELAALGVDIVVVTSGAHAVRAVQSAMAGVPIVVVGLGDPVGQGLVASLARPGGNITGTSDVNVDLVPKRLELLKTALPRAVRIVNVQGNFGTFDAARTAAILDAQEAAARALGIMLVRVQLNTQSEFADATAAVVRERPDALLLSPNPLNFILRRELADFGLQQRLAVMGPGREWTSAGALMSYGASNEDTFRKSAVYVAKILGGAKPGELAIEEPTRFELAINATTAKAIGVTIPPQMLQRADEIFQ